MIRKAIIVVLTLGTVGTGVLLVASYLLPRKSSGWIWGWEPERSAWIVGLRPGVVTLNHYPQPPVETRPGAAFLGFRYTNYEGKILGYWTPLWFLTLLSAAYPTLAFIRGPLRRHRRRKRGLCVRCEYNLTGLPEPRCPECGETT